MLGERIRAARKLKGISQQVLADSLTVAKSTISQYETNTNRPHPEMLRRIAECLDTSVDYLVGHDPRPVNPAVREIVENQDPKDLQLTPAEVRRLTELLEDPELHVAFRKGVLAKKVNPRRLLKTLELLAMDDDEWDKE